MSKSVGPGNSGAEVSWANAAEAARASLIDVTEYSDDAPQYGAQKSAPAAKDRRPAEPGPNAPEHPRQTMVVGLSVHVATKYIPQTRQVVGMTSMKKLSKGRPATDVVQITGVACVWQFHGPETLRRTRTGLPLSMSIARPIKAPATKTTASTSINL